MSDPVSSQDLLNAFETDSEIRRALIEEAKNGFPIAIVYGDASVSTFTFDEAEAIFRGERPIAEEAVTPVAILFFRIPEMTADELARGDRIAADIELLFKARDPAELN